MNLFDIDVAIQNCIDFETGEILDEEALTGLEMERSRKIRNIACWIKNLESDIDELEKQEKTFAERKKSAKNKKDSLKKYLSSFLNGEKVSEPEFQIGWRKSQELVVEDDAKVPEEFWRIKREVAKTDLKDAVKKGLVLEGIYLKDNNNIQIK